MKLPKGIESGDLATLVVLLAGYAIYFVTGAYLITAFSPILLCLMGVVYLALNIWGSRHLDAWGKPQMALYFMIALGLGGAINYYSSGATWLILLPLVSEAFQRLSLPVAVFTTFFAWVGQILPVVMSGNMANTMSAAMGYLSAVVFVAVFTLITVNEQKMRRQLAEANNRLREYTRQMEENAILQERNRMAREIHDGLGHYLTSVNIQLKAAKSIMPQDTAAADEALAKAIFLTQEALNDVRRSVSALRSDQPSETIASAAIRPLLNMEVEELKVDLSVEGTEVALPPSLIWVLYRAAQEALTNIRKHAEAKNASVRLRYLADEVEMQIVDDGVGAENLEGGYGLVGLQERVQIYGGRVETSTAPGRGVSLTVCIPIPGVGG